MKDTKELVEWCREQNLSATTTYWLIEHEEELIDLSAQEIDAIICKLEKEMN